MELVETLKRRKAILHNYMKLNGRGKNSNGVGTIVEQELKD